MKYKSTPMGFSHDQWHQVLKVMAQGIRLPKSFNGYTGAIPHLIEVNKDVSELRPEMRNL